MKLSFKKTTLTALFTASVLLTSPATIAGGIPTVDFAALDSWMKQSNQMTQQIAQFEQQIQNQIDHLKAIKGARGVGKVDAVLDVFEKAPDEWADIYKTAQNIDPSKTLKDIKIDPDQEIKHAEMLKQEAIKDGKNLTKIFKELSSIAQDIKSGKIQDTKDAADLTNRIQINTAMISAMQAKYDLMEREMRQKERLQAQAITARRSCAYKKFIGKKCD